MDRVAAASAQRLGVGFGPSSQDDRSQLGERWAPAGCAAGGARGGRVAALEKHASLVRPCAREGGFTDRHSLWFNREQASGGRTMQVMYTFIEGRTRALRLPGPDAFVLPGVRWGRFDALLTAAYWRGQAWQYQLLGQYSNLRLGRTLVEEVAACLLGGYGMPAELGLAAYARLRDRCLLTSRSSLQAIEDALVEPFEMEGRKRQYRFPRQKARRLKACLERLPAFEEPESDTEFRDALATLPGVGPKTASWITRNYRGSDAVAIVDVHILRAGRVLQLFPVNWTPQAHYRELEARFVAFARALATPAGLLDGVMWDHMRRLPSRAGEPHQLQLKLS
jgi:thermostable 8-oxoguanine DNA glycosylase